MKEQAHWEEPDSKDIHKRFFDYMKDAKHFAHGMFEDGFHVTIKTDGGSSWSRLKKNEKWNWNV